jgi:hypothetical protein
MPKMSHAREDHGDAMFICRSDHFVVFDRTAGLND